MIIKMVISISFALCSVTTTSFCLYFLSLAFCSLISHSESNRDPMMHFDFDYSSFVLYAIYVSLAKNATHFVLLSALKFIEKRYHEKL